MVQKGWQRQQPGSRIVKEATIEGTLVGDVLLDTGCTRTLVRRELVPEEMLQGGSVAVRCAHGDTVLYPLAEVELEMDGRSLQVEAAVSNGLPVSMLLGTDVPVLAELLEGELRDKKLAERSVSVEEAMLVTTRAWDKQQAEEGKERQEKQIQSGVQAKTLGALDRADAGPTDEQEGPNWMECLDEELFDCDVVRERPRKTQSATHEERRRRWQERAAEDEMEGEWSDPGEDATEESWTGEPEDPMVAHPLDIPKAELQRLQDRDETLKAVREAEDGHPSSAVVGFFRRDGLVYCRWTPL